MSADQVMTFLRCNMSQFTSTELEQIDAMVSAEQHERSFCEHRSSDPHCRCTSEGFPRGVLCAHCESLIPREAA